MTGPTGTTVTGPTGTTVTGPTGTAGTGPTGTSRRGAGARQGLVTAVLTLAATAAGAGAGVLVGGAAQSVSGHRNAPWILGRASGLTAYLLLVLLVVLGLGLSHPWRTRLTWPSPAARVRLHVSVAAGTAAFVLLHLVVLATDRYAGVGWAGAFVPTMSHYRPVAVSLGIIGFYAGLAAGLTAALSGRFAARVWWPVHKVAAVSLALVWLHGVWAGSDTNALRLLYLASGALVVLLAVTRYAARNRSDRAEELARPGARVGGRARTRADVRTGAGR